MKAWSRYMRRDRTGGGRIGGARFLKNKTNFALSLKVLF